MKTISAMAAMVLIFLPIASQAANNEAGSWDSKAAAAYLDQRAGWWMGWDQSVRDHDTHCVSCHTAVPYALGRPALRAVLGEQAPSATEQQLLANVTKRVRLWGELEPFYSDEKRGAPKTAESRGTEAVLNALILTNYDAHQGKLSDDTRLALDNMWALQLKTGEGKGAWTWLNFHNQPWEADDSQFWGATLGAIAAGRYPGRLSRNTRDPEQSEAALRIPPARHAERISHQPGVSSVGFREGARNSEA
jgi:squalene-hopene/tetraprenyl-beta-curcumene cyclase